MGLHSEPTHTYQPSPGGWRIHLCDEAPCDTVAHDTQQGADGGSYHDPRRHRRPLYPPPQRDILVDLFGADATLRLPLRPVVVAFNGPRLLLDFHHAGGLLAHLTLGFVAADGSSAWLHDWQNIEVRYRNGCMEYALTDARFPGVVIELNVAPLATAAGAALRWRVSGAAAGTLVFCCSGCGACPAWADFEAPFKPRPPHVPDQFSCDAGTFTLQRSFAAAPPRAPDLSLPLHPAPFTATVLGRSSGHASTGFADAVQIAGGPNALLASATWYDGAAQTNDADIVVQCVRFAAADDATGHFVIGMGPGMGDVLHNPANAYAAARERTDAIAGRVEINTPDARLNAAAATMAFSLEGTWGDLSYLHGAWTWRFAYLGWRGWYGPNCYGWSERVKTAIESHLRLTRIEDGDDRGGLTSTIEYPEPPVVYYNMNEVFLDQVRHYFDYTGDLDFMREIFPALQEIVAWENRRLKPNDEPLYENVLNTWISDSHWQIRAHGAQASAYMLNAHRFMARLAAHLGEDAAPWQSEAERIHAAMQRVLWQPRVGVFADARDTLGHQLLHAEPELPTIYHSAEFGAADARQIYQMLHWADTHLRAESTENGGRLYWSSNWQPNHGRSYTHSTHELAYAESLNYALTNYLGGRADDGWALIAGALDGIFDGPTPGGLSAHAATDGRQRNNDEFADALSMWARAVIEGLFGIAVRRPDGVVALCPQFPPAWPESAIATPHFSYEWQHAAGRQTIAWQSPVPTRVQLRLQLKASVIDSVSIDGMAARYETAPGIGCTWLTLETGTANAGNIEVVYSLSDIIPPHTIATKVSDSFEVDLSAHSPRAIIDPQGILAQATLTEGVLRGVVAGEPGPGLLFMEAGTAACPYELPVKVTIEPATPKSTRRWMSPPGTARDSQRWRLVDLQHHFNTPLTEAITRAAKAALPPPLPASHIGFEYRSEFAKVQHMATGRAGMDLPVSDGAWRAKVDTDGIAWTAEGVPFKSPAGGDNLAAVSLLGGFPPRLDLPVGAGGSMLYLMLSGVTWPAQTHVVNLRLTLHYSDGAREVHDLENPRDITDCWDVWHGWWHDCAAAGFENLGGRFGPAGSNEVPDLTRPVEVDTTALLVNFALRPDVTLYSVELEAIANDVVFGIMGVSILI